MKEQKDPSRKSISQESARRRGRESRQSVSSKKSVRSIDSDLSRSSPAVAFGRPRGLSFTSIKSNAVSDGSAHSDSTNAISRKTSHADDSDASNSNSSLGETDQDVWFPNDAAGDEDINLDELDQLLNLSDDGPEDQRVPPVGDHEQAVVDDADYGEGADIEDNAELPMSSGSGERIPLKRSHSSATTVGRNPASRQSADRRKSTSIAPVKESRRVHNFRPIPIGNDTNSNESEKDEPRFVRYVSPDFPQTQNPGYLISQAAGECLSSESSTNAEKEKISLPSEDTSFLPSNDPSHKAGGPSGTGGNDGNAAEQPSQRFSFFASGLDNTIHAPDLASLVGDSDSFGSLLDPSNGAWFLDCFRPTDIEMKALSRAFGIHPLTAEDIQTEDAREKYEQFKNYYLVVYHTFESDKEDPNYMESINFYMLVFKEGVISFHFEPVSHCRNVRRRMRQLRDYINFSPDWIAYALIDDITDSFAPEIASVEKEADYVEDAVYLDTNAEVGMHDLLRRLGLARRHTMHLLRMLSGKADVVRGFAKRCTEVRSVPATEMGLYLGDIQDHIATMYQNLSAYEKIFSRTHFNYMGLLQMEFVDSSNRMTNVLGKVTVLGSILLPMNLITGLWGMNVHVPGQDVENLHWFFGIMASILFCLLVLLSAGLYFVHRSESGNKQRN